MAAWLRALPRFVLPVHPHDPDDVYFGSQYGHLSSDHDVRLPPAYRSDRHAENEPR